MTASGAVEMLEGEDYERARVQRSWATFECGFNQGTLGCKTQKLIQKEKGGLVEKT